MIRLKPPDIGTSLPVSVDVSGHILLGGQGCSAGEARLSLIASCGGMVGAVTLRGQAVGAGRPAATDVRYLEELTMFCLSKPSGRGGGGRS